MRFAFVVLAILALVGCGGPQGTCMPNTSNPSFYVDMPNGWDATVYGGFVDPNHVVLHYSEIDGRALVYTHLTKEEAADRVAHMLPLVREQGWTIRDDRGPSLIVASHGTQRRALAAVKVDSCSTRCARWCYAFVDMQSDHAGFSGALAALETMGERITLR